MVTQTGAKPLTLEVLIEAFEYTQRRATPHRTPDFEKIKERLGDIDDDAPVYGRLWFIEQHNTGWEGNLERWEFSIEADDGVRIAFWADLIPGMILGKDGPVPPVGH